MGERFGYLYNVIQGLPFGPLVMHLMKDDDYTAVGVDVAVGLVAPVTRNQNT